MRALGGDVEREEGSAGVDFVRKRGVIVVMVGGDGL